MNPQIGQEISLLRELIGQYNDLGIVIGTHQNLDTYAAALALHASLKQANKQVQIISKKEPTVEVSNLVGIDKVKPRFTASNTSKLVISLPYIKGEVEKVLFTEYPNPQNPNRINFHLTAAEGRNITPFDKNDVDLIWEGGTPSVIIAVGVGSIDELSGFIDANSAKIVNIDNYQGNTRFGDVVLVDEMFSSLSEISGKIIKDLSLPSDVDASQNVLDGVLFATKNFTKPNTSPFAFEAVSTAMYNGAKRQSGQGNVVREERARQPREERPRRDMRQNEPRVREDDFPAVHMRGRNDDQQSTRDERQNEPRKQNQPQRQFGHDRNDRPLRNDQRPQKQFGQNPNDIEELMRKINEENAKRDQGQKREERQAGRQDDRYQGQRVQDAQLVDERSFQNDQEPEERPYTPPDPSEVPDDWLTPKVFKSSKRNN